MEIHGAQYPMYLIEISKVHFPIVLACVFFIIIPQPNFTCHFTLPSICKLYCHLYETEPFTVITSNPRVTRLSQIAKFVGPVGPRWAPYWPHEPCYLGCILPTSWEGKWVLAAKAALLMFYYRAFRAFISNAYVQPNVLQLSPPE